MPRLLALGLVLVALALRLWSLGDRTFAHPENFAPGIDMPDWVKHPPERLTMESVLRGTLTDGHPPTYFLALLPWVKTFGTSLESLRMPSALLGAASVWLLFLVGRRLHGVRVGLTAAALLALHGFGIYWSQLARMYMPTAFLMLLSTLFLLKSLEEGRLRDHVGYFLATAVALWTQIYAWPVVVGQAIWVACRIVAGASGASMVRAVTLAVVAGTPVIQLAAYQNPATRWHEPAAGYLGFGYLYSTILPFWGDAPWRPPAALLVALCLALMVAALPAAATAATARAAADTVPPERERDLVRWLPILDWVLAAGVSALMLLLSWRAFGLGKKNLALSVLPFALVAASRIVLALAARLAERPPSARVRELASRVPLEVVLATVPAAIVAIVSVGRGIWVQRGTVVFLPWLLLVVATGLVALLEARPRALRLAGVAAALAVAVVWAGSIPYAHAASTSPRDYAGLARELTARYRPGDFIIAREDYGVPPFFYYWPRTHDAQLIHLSRTDRAQRAGQLARVDGAPVGARFWVLRFCAVHFEDDAAAALSRLTLSELVPVQGGELILLTKGERPDSLARSWSSREGSVGCDDGGIEAAR